VSDLVITKHVDRPAAVVGERLRYTITVANRGPDPATGVRLVDVLALPARVVSIHVEHGHCQTGPPLTCALGTLHAAAHTTITITAVATVAGEQTNTAGIVSESKDPHPSTSVASARTRIARAHAVTPPPPPFTG
jgi:uncharacterized repeat protein (TIGR01451 family)